MVWAMTVSMDRVMRSSVLRRMMSSVRFKIEGRREEEVRQQNAKEQQCAWEYYCGLVQLREQEQERCRQAKEREKQYREAQAWWVLASEETSSNVDFTACCTYVPKEREWGGEFLRLATTFDTLSQINGIVESCVIDGWKWLDRHNDVNGVGGKSMAVVGTVVVPGWALAMGGEVQDVECVVFRSMPQHNYGDAGRTAVD